MAAAKPKAPAKVWLLVDGALIDGDSEITVKAKDIMARAEDFHGSAKLSWDVIEYRVAAYPKMELEIKTIAAKSGDASRRLNELDAALERIAPRVMPNMEANNLLRAIRQFIKEGPAGTYGIGSGPNAFSRWGF